MNSLMQSNLPVKAGTTLEQTVNWLRDNALIVILVLLASAIIYRLLSIAINRSVSLISKNPFISEDQAKQRALTLANVLDALAKFTIFFLAVLVILQSTTKVEITALLAGAGVLGVAVGLAAQSLIKDFLSGFFILFENQYSVGDLVQIGSDKGTVEQLSLRTTLLRDFQGSLHIIPNSQVTVVINHSRGWARAVVEFGVPTTQNPQRVLDTVCDEMTKLADDPTVKDVLQELPQVTGIEEFRDNAMVFRIAVRTASSEQDRVERLIRERIAARLTKEQIEVIGKPAQ
ncbi:MAG TPA: mechanosensitive ion channel family protein [Candidatus Aquicultor sp.]